MSGFGWVAAHPAHPAHPDSIRVFLKKKPIETIGPWNDRDCRVPAAQFDRFENDRAIGIFLS